MRHGIGQNLSRRGTADQLRQTIDELADGGARAVGDVIDAAARCRCSTGLQDRIDHVADVNDGSDVVAAADKGEFAAAEGAGHLRQVVSIARAVDEARPQDGRVHAMKPPVLVNNRLHVDFHVGRGIAGAAAGRVLIGGLEVARAQHVDGGENHRSSRTVLPQRFQ